MKIRLMGTREECAAAVTALRRAQSLTVAEVSDPYPNRGGSALVRVYAEVSVDTASVQQDGGGRR